MSRHKKPFLVIFLILLVALLTSCNLFTQASDWARRDMPTDGLTHLVEYNLQGPANSDQEENWAELRGVNDFSPRIMLDTQFGRSDGTKTQDVFVTMPNGQIFAILGMTKTRRYAGITKFATLEPATYAIQDAEGNVFCGAKVRLDFNRNMVQYLDGDQRDFQSLFYYDIPCPQVAQVGEVPVLQLDTDKATLRAVVLNEVWNGRFATGSVFFNWGHSVTILDGPAADLKAGWWENWDVPGNGDAMEALDLVNSMVLDLESSPYPWLEFHADGRFKDSWVMYSASDADQFANWDRALLNRQKQYAVFYRPTRETPWDYVVVEPLYNYEWNDVHNNLWALKSWLGDPESFNPYNANGSFKTDIATTDMIKEIERIGWMNAPNPALDQIRWLAPDGTPLYAMTVRAHMGAADTLVIFGDAIPDFNLRNEVEMLDNQPQPPLVVDEAGNEAPTQPWDANRWLDWQRENSFWNYLRDNPNAVSADLLIQYRFKDNTSYTEVYCHNSDGDRYVCGYEPVIWNLSATYYMEGDPEDPWHVLQSLGEVGVRTLGLSYVSGRFQGTGIEFALDQRLFYQRYYTGMSQEDVWLFDARAMQLPDTLAKTWAILHGTDE